MLCPEFILFAAMHVLHHATCGYYMYYRLTNKQSVPRWQPSCFIDWMSSQLNIGDEPDSLGASCFNSFNFAYKGVVSRL